MENILRHASLPATIFSMPSRMPNSNSSRSKKIGWRTLFMLREWVQDMRLKTTLIDTWIPFLDVDPVAAATIVCCRPALRQTIEKDVT